MEVAQQLTPLQLFWATFAFSAIGAVGALLASSRKLSARLLIGHAIKYGCWGAGGGAFVYNFMGGKKAPEMVIATGGLVGAGAIKLKDLQNIVKRSFGIPIDNGKDDDEPS